MIHNVFSEFQKSLLPPVKQSLFSWQLLHMLLFVFIVVLAFLAGWYQVQYQDEKKLYQTLEDKYVRLQLMLGQEETKNLIQESYQYIDNQGVILKEKE